MADNTGTIVCMVCGITIQENVPGFEGTSHGVCPGCYDKYLEKIRKDQEEWKNKQRIQQPS